VPLLYYLYNWGVIALLPAPKQAGTLPHYDICTSVIDLITADWNAEVKQNITDQGLKSNKTGR